MRNAPETAPSSQEQHHSAHPLELRVVFCDRGDRLPRFALQRETVEIILNLVAALSRLEIEEIRKLVSHKLIHLWDKEKLVPFVLSL